MKMTQKNGFIFGFDCIYELCQKKFQNAAKSDERREKWRKKNDKKLFSKR
jgi:hypothetical protein